MKFINKQLAMILKEKGFNRPCFGYYYIETPTRMNEGEIVYNKCNTRGAIYKDCLYSSNYDYYFDIHLVNKVDAPTIKQVLKWLREEKDTYITIVPQKEFDYICYSLSIIQFNSPKHNFDTFRMNSFFDSITINYDDIYIIGIEYVIKNLI